MTVSPGLRDHTETGNGLSSDINEMKGEKGKTCISVIVPTHRMGQDRQGDRIEIQEAITVARQEALVESNELFDALDELFLQIDYNQNKEGIGLFVSSSIKKIVRFPFPVTKKIVVNKYFDLHDLLYFENYQAKYYLLDISRKEIHLFHGIIDHLEEIKEGIFPKIITEEYEYNKPNQSTSDAGYAHEKGFEKDKSILAKIRMKNYFRQADKSLSKYLVTKETPLLLCGSQENISIYKSATKYSDNIVACMGDNYRDSNIHDLEVFAWLQIRSFLDGQKLQLIKEAKEKMGRALTAVGIKEVWKAAKAGRGLKLLVEKEYDQPAFITDNDILFLQHPGEKHVICPDAVNEIMTTVLEKKGTVIIVEKDILGDLQRMALILRY